MNPVFIHYLKQYKEASKEASFKEAVRALKETAKTAQPIIEKTVETTKPVVAKTPLLKQIGTTTTNLTGKGKELANKGIDFTKNVAGNMWDLTKKYPKTVGGATAAGTYGVYRTGKSYIDLRKAKAESAARIAEAESASTRNKAIGYGAGSAALAYILLKLLKK